MEVMDWLDLAMHGAPWIALIVILLSMATAQIRTRNN